MARWALRLGTAAVAGSIVRIARRIAGKPPRIWHGFSPLHSTSWMVRAERAAGFPSISVVTNTRAHKYALVRAEDFDRVFEDSAGARWDDVHWRALAHLLLHGDIWTAYFDCLFAHWSEHRKNVLIFRLIRLSGIRIVVQPHGSDWVCLGKITSRYDWPELMQRDYPSWDLAAQKPIVEERIALFDRFADFVIAGDSTIEPILPRFDAGFHTVGVDLELLRPVSRTPRDVPVILHAPNHRHVKGTPYLLEALEQLRARGFAFELRLIERVPRHEALAMYGDADIIADQFMIGGYGIFGLEGMALGRPVLTYMDETHLSRSVYNDPVVNTMPENIQRVLAVLIAVPELRERIGAASRKSIERYHSFEAVGEVWKRVYDNVWNGKPLDLESTRLFEPQRGTRSLSEDPAVPEFWPVPVDDLWPQIIEALKRSSAGEIGSAS
jgi:glycosyltransferase involved in cell wall biosynthesis